MSLYSVILALHIMAVVVAFGLPLVAPLFVPWARRSNPRAMAGVHDVQLRFTQRITGPGTVLVLAFGIYLATKAHAWDEVWVHVPIAVILAIGGIGGAIITPALRKLAELARTDIAAAGPSGDVRFGAEYEAVYRRYMTAERVLAVLVLVAIFFMAAKPGS